MAAARKSDGYHRALASDYWDARNGRHARFEVPVPMIREPPLPHPHGRHITGLMLCVTIMAKSKRTNGSSKPVSGTAQP